MLLKIGKWVSWMGNLCITLMFFLKLHFTFSRGDRRFDKPGRKDVGKTFCFEVFLYGFPWH